MKHVLKYLTLVFVSIFLTFGLPLQTNAAEDDPVYTTLRSIDLGTFNEYRYKVTEEFFKLKEHFEIYESMSIPILKNIGVVADKGYNYLPDNLKNKNYLNNLLIELQKGVKNPGSEIVYVEVIKAIASYLEDTEIQSLKGSIEATPISGNAPMTVTLRGKVQDPSGTQIPYGNYTWWIDEGGERVIIGRGPSIQYSFANEGIFSVFLDVTSSHRNDKGYTDILPFRSRVDISVNEKIASLVIRINSDRVGDDELKFTPEEANYGLVFDATSSTPTDGTTFSRTEWDFGNGIRRSYNGGPKVERIRYGREGDYVVNLKLTTNERKVIEKIFYIYIHDPIAKIQVNREDGYIGDKFTFSAKTSGIYRNLTYNWEIINIDTDRVVYQKSDKILTYSFSDKGKYNVKLRVRRSSGEVDEDTRIVYVTSQSPIAEYESSVPLPHKPNRVFLDASRSFDPDFTDDGNLRYEWYIDGNRVNLEDANANGSVGYFTFNSVGTHSVNLEVTDPDGITNIKKGTVEVDSILSVEMFAFPRVIQRNGFIRFVAESPEAQVYEWDFGDGQTKGGNFDKVTHTFEKSGKFDVRLKVSDPDNNTNTYTKTIYVSDSDMPYAFIDVSYGSLERPVYDADACSGAGAYIVNRVNTLSLNGNESVNIDGETSNLEYSWRIGYSKFSSSANVSHKFDEIGCFPVKLSVKSKDNGKTHSSEVMMDVRNMKPTLTGLSVVVENPQEDPLIVRVNAQGARDNDGVIQSYLWYYYTDTDTEPQDFRSTASSSTAFVIPKVTGNYYFVAILKDNNEARITSEEITGSRYFTTITGDNINTPIVELSLNDNSTVIGEEVTFTAKANNILGQNIEKDATFSWDFDGDGFYDTQTSEPSTTYKYRKSGEFYAKVKVKYKGISSTKNVTVNVSNKLVADFEYISIGNKFIFFDTSYGQIDSRSWDLGDGTKKSGTNFEYQYTDNKASHVVNLKITEGTKVKETQKTVTKNVKNILKTKGKPLVLFSSPQVDEDGKIVLEAASQKVFVYLGESSEDTVVYAIDYDIEHDSDLNGGMDDDEDNKGTASYVSGSVTEIPLSQYMNQKVRVFIKDADGNILGSEDIHIEKTYIEETDIDPSTIIFEDVTESEREKIEELKNILVELPQQQKLKALSYVQKLQENWNDSTEKTRTILDFEGYIFELGLSNEDELITILESLLVEGQEDQSTRNITYQALVNLIPKEIECDAGEGTCYDSLLAKLEDIKNSDDIEYNKTLGKEILEVVGNTDLMDTTQKLDFKAILTSLVYGGDVNAIPDSEKQDVIDATPDGEEESSGGIMGILLFVLKILGYFILIFIVLIAGFYILYLILNKDSGQSFTEFVSKTTSFGKDDDIENSGDNGEEDILQETLPDQAIETQDSDPLFGETTEPKKQEPEVQPQKMDVQPIEEKKDPQEVKEEVPDWLKGNFSPDTPSDNSQEGSTASLEEEKNKVDVSEPVEESGVEEPIKEPIKEDIKQQDIPKISQEIQEDFDIEKETKIEDSNIPDWLKGSVESEEKTSKNIPKEKTISQTDEPQLNAPSDTKLPEVKEDTSLEDSNVPDWLKGSFDTPKSEEKKDIQEDIKEEKITDEKPKKNTSALKKKTKVVQTDVKKEEETPKTPKKTGAKKKSKKTEDIVKTSEPKKEKKEELWDDGMKVPDWLKSDTDEK